MDAICTQSKVFQHLQEAGMEGDPVKDPDSVFVGQRLKNGWKNSGVPGPRN